MEADFLVENTKLLEKNQAVLSEESKEQGSND